MFKLLKFGYWLFFVSCLLFLVSSQVLAVPQYINYQGVLRDSAGDLVAGTKEMTFSLYSASTGGSALWTMTSSEVVVSNGLYTVHLGPITSANIGSGDRWLEVAVGGTTLTPRLKILSVAYAITAADSALLDGFDTGVSGLSIIPTTDATTGKLSTSVIPTSGLTYDTAAYAILAGSATTAATVSDNAITSAKILDETIVSADIDDGTIVADDIASNAITLAKMEDNSVDTAELVADAVTSAKIENETIVSADIKDGTIVSADIKDGTIAAADLLGTIAITTTGTLTINQLASGGSGNGYYIGIDTVTAGNETKAVSNTAIEADSIIFLTGNYDTGGAWVTALVDNGFTFNSAKYAPGGGGTFNYLIINP